MLRQRKKRFENGLAKSVHSPHKTETTPYSRQFRSQTPANVQKSRIQILNSKWTSITCVHANLMRIDECLTIGVYRARAECALAACILLSGRLHLIWTTLRFAACPTHSRALSQDSLRHSDYWQIRMLIKEMMKKL